MSTQIETEALSAIAQAREALGAFEACYAEDYGDAVIRCRRYEVTLPGEVIHRLFCAVQALEQVSALAEGTPATTGEAR